MNKIIKIVLSIPSIIGFIFLISLFIPDLKNWTEKILEREIQEMVLIGLIAFQQIILIFRIWSFKNITTSKKAENTFYLIGFNLVGGFIYIWKTDNYFIKLNKKSIQKIQN